jgi:hypothetical protein
MKTKNILQLDPSAVHVRLGMCAAALVGTAGAVPNADAAIINFNTPIVVPNNFTGVYLDLATGTTSFTGSFPAFDFNPYSNGGTLGFFWGTGAGGVAGTTTGPYLSLAPGTVVGPASTYSNVIAGTVGSPYLTTGTNTLGFRFTNEGTGAVDYGYMTVSTTAAAATASPGTRTNFGTTKVRGTDSPDINGFPMTIMSWSFDDTGAPITVVPEPSTAALLTISALAAGALGLRKWRRSRAA